MKNLHDTVEDTQKIVSTQPRLVPVIQTDQTVCPVVCADSTGGCNTLDTA